MAFRPNRDLLSLSLDNTEPGVVRGLGVFLGTAGPRIVVFDLEGDFDDDIRGQRIAISGPGHSLELPKQVQQTAHPGEVDHMGPQRGKVGDASFGLNGLYPGYPYIEWFTLDPSGRAIGRSVIEQPDYSKVAISGEPFSASWNKSGPKSADLIQEVNENIALAMSKDHPNVRVMTMDGHSDLMRTILQGKIESGHGPIT